MALILDNEIDLTVVGQANNGREAVELFSSLQLDIALRSQNLSEGEG